MNTNSSSLVFVPQSGVAQELVDSICSTPDWKVLGVGYIVSIPPAYTDSDESWSFSSTQICGGETWKEENESVNEYAERLLKTNWGTDPYDPNTEYGVEYWIIGFSGQGNPSEEPTLIHRICATKY